MKAILVPVEHNDLIDSTLQAAWLLGAMFGSAIDGFALGPAVSAFIAPDSIGGAIVYDVDAGDDGEAVRESRRMFETAMAGRSAGGAGASPTVGWLDGVSHGDAFVGSTGRVFDITILGRPVASPTGPRMSTLETALFESGRPVLIAPPTKPARLGEVVAIAWNRSAETARTVAFALPLLQRARRISVLSIEGGSVEGPSGEDLARYLQRNGIAADVIPIEKSAGKAIGIALLDKAGEIGSDLLIKGAFTQSRLSQMIFGGATRDILAEANLPVFMAH